MSTKRAAGKTIITVEGLSEREKEAFVYAFGAMGSVQCGFCTPGMVMAGKALIDRSPAPTEAEIKQAVRGNICRCTGYKKIIEGKMCIRDSAEAAVKLYEDFGAAHRAERIRKELGL